jgi:NAD(P)-dependent dehydrogenase (short-subunit alcohol dehydrogenase family)
VQLEASVGNTLSRSLAPEQKWSLPTCSLAKRQSQRFSARGRSARVKADVTDEKSTQAMAAEAERRFGRIDVLVNNAAFYVGALTRALAHELSGTGINVNTLTPGFTMTDASKTLADRESFETLKSTFSICRSSSAARNLPTSELQ